MIYFFIINFQSRQETISPEFKKSANRSAQPHSSANTKLTVGGGLADITVHATPPQHRRKLFNAKSLRSPFGQRRPPASTAENSTLSGECLLSIKVNYLQNSSHRNSLSEFIFLNFK